MAQAGSGSEAAGVDPVVESHPAGQEDWEWRWCRPSQTYLRPLAAKLEAEPRKVDLGGGIDDYEARRDATTPSDSSMTADQRWWRWNVEESDGAGRRRKILVR